MDWGAFQLFQGFGRLRFLTRLSRMLLGQGYIRVLPLSLMLCSLVCLQTHRKPQNLLGYGNKCLKQCISKNFFFFFFNGEIGVYLFIFFIYFLFSSSKSSYLWVQWLPNTTWNIFPGLEKLGAILAHHPVFCLLIPLGYHVCCNKWFLLARLEHFPQLPLFWW